MTKRIEYYSEAMVNNRINNLNMMKVINYSKTDLDFGGKKISYGRSFGVGMYITSISTPILGTIAVGAADILYRYTQKYTVHFFDSEGNLCSSEEEANRKSLGFNKEGYNASGYNKDGYNKSGYNSSGYNVQGRNSQGKTKEEVATEKAAPDKAAREEVTRKEVIEKAAREEAASKTAMEKAAIEKGAKEEEAHKKAEEAENIDEFLNHLRDGVTFLQKGKAELAEDNFDEALAVCNRAEQYFDNAYHQRLLNILSECYINLITLYNEAGNSDAAQDLCRKCSKNMFINSKYATTFEDIFLNIQTADQTQLINFIRDMHIYSAEEITDQVIQLAGSQNFGE
jgi:hypothetical protein